MEPTETKPAANKPQRFDVVLAGKHEHGGTLYGKGDTIKGMREDQVKRLEKRDLVASKKPAKAEA